MADPTRIKSNGNTTGAGSYRMNPNTIVAATTINGIASTGRLQSKDKGLDFGDYFAKGWNWFKGGWGDLLGGGQTGYRDPGTFSSSVATEAQASNISGSSFKKSGGLGSLVSTVLGGLAGQGLSLGGIISGIGGFFTEKSKMKFNLKKLEIDEALGKENNAINRLIAEGNIAENKRRTAISSTFMGHTNPIAAVEGVTGIEPGLQVADQWVSPEVRKQSGGALGGSNQGLITQGNQRKIS